MGYKIRGRGAAICVLVAALWLVLGAAGEIASAAPQDPHLALLEITAQAAAEANEVAAGFAAFAATRPTQAQLDKAYAEAQEDLAEIEADALDDIAGVVENHPGNLTVQNAALVATGVVTGAVDYASASITETVETATTTTVPTTIPSVSTTIPSVSTTIPSVSTTLPSVSTTLPSVSTTIPSVSTTLPTTSTTSTTVASVTATSTTTVPESRSETTVPAGGPSPESPAAASGSDAAEEDDPETATSFSDDSSTPNSLGPAPAADALTAPSLSLAIDVAAGEPVPEEAGLTGVVSFDRLDSFLRTAIPSGLSEPIIDGFTLLRTIGLAFMSGVQAISWPVLALAFTSFLLYDRRTAKGQV